MSFTKPGMKPDGGIDGCLRLGQAPWRAIDRVEIDLIVRVRELTVGKVEGRIAHRCFFKKLRRLHQIVDATRFEDDALDQSLTAQVEIIGDDIACRFYLHRCPLLRGKLSFQLEHNFLRDFGLDSENIRQVPVITIRPTIRVPLRPSTSCAATRT